MKKRKKKLISKNKGFLIYRMRALVCESSNISHAINQVSFETVQYSHTMKINPQKICKHRSYLIKEISGLLSIDEKTCFRWIEDGLKILPGCKKPILIKGSDLKEFITNRKIKKKIPLNRNQFLCMTCKKASYAKRGSIRVTKDKKTASCRVCNGNMSRII